MSRSWPERLRAGTAGHGTHHDGPAVASTITNENEEEARSLLREQAFGPQAEFRKWGASGQEVSELFPEIGGIADQICILRSLHT
ncbi:MAG: hypothetical protein ACK48X_15580, partial [Planctomycetota bacterium]